MKTLKHFLVFSALLAVLISCGEGGGMYVRREVADELTRENETLKTDLSSAQQRYLRQSEELGSILRELASLSVKSSNVQLSLANGEAPRSVVDSVYDEIAFLRDRIEKLDREAARARKNDKELALSKTTIDNLRAAVASQEKQIAVLKKRVGEQERVIREQTKAIGQKDSTIAVRNSVIDRQHDEILGHVEKLREMLYQAGVEFESIADDGDFEVRGRKNRTSVSDYRKAIYEEARVFYDTAAEQGHAKAEIRSELVKEKIARL